LPEGGEKVFLEDVLSKKTVVVELKGHDKNAIMAELTDCLADEKVLSDKDAFLKAIKEREVLESTAIGGGIAIPHAKHESVKRIFCAMGIIKDGVEFNALDGKPVTAVLMVASHPDLNREYIQVVARAARLLKSEVMMQKIYAASSSPEIMKVIADFDRILHKASVDVSIKEGRVIHKDT